MKARERMAGVDLALFVRSSSALIGRRIKKAYQLGPGLFSLTIHPAVDGKKEFILSLENAAFLSEYNWPKPEYPTSLAMGVRKWASNARIVGIEQSQLERVMRVRYRGENEGELIVELFGRGNLIVTDGEGKIVQLASRRRMRDRNLARGEPYKQPPTKALQLDELDESSLLDEMRDRQQLELWRFLIECLEIGPPYLDEVLWGSGISASAKIQSLEADQLRGLATRAMDLLGRVEGPADPTLYLVEGRPVNFAPFPLESLDSKFERQGMDDYLQLLDRYFLPMVSAKAAFPFKKDLDRQIRSLESEIERQRALVDDFIREEGRCRARGDLIYSNLHEFQELIDVARRGSAEPRVKEADRKAHRAVIEAQGALIEVDYLRNAADNASAYYRRAKKMARKQKGAKRALQDLSRKLEEKISQEKSVIMERRPRERKSIERTHREWFERFRWFHSSDGLLVLAGRDRANNKELVKGHLGRSDLFFHVDRLRGAAVVVKKDSGEPGAATIEEAADFAASFSRAWREGLSYADVYYVGGEQVSDHAPPGLYIPKGSFYISGKRRRAKGRLQLSIGIVERKHDYRVISCPIGAAKGMKSEIVVVPGELTKLEAARRIRSALQEALKKRDVDLYLDVDEITRALPSGKFRLLRGRG